MTEKLACQFSILAVPLLALNLKLFHVMHFCLSSLFESKIKPNAIRFDEVIIFVVFVCLMIESPF